VSAISHEHGWHSLKEFRLRGPLCLERTLLASCQVEAEAGQQSFTYLAEILMRPVGFVKP